MLHVGLDLSRRRLDVHVLDDQGTTITVTAIPPDGEALRRLAEQLAGYGEPVRAAVESMTGARFIHDQLELVGWDVDLADAQKVKGLAPLACKTDRIDARVLAELCRRDLVPAIWLPTPGVRADRERARWRHHVIQHRTALKNRIHAVLMTLGHPCPVSDLFGAAGRQLLDALQLPEPWASTVLAALAVIDELDVQIAICDRDIRRYVAADPRMQLLRTVPGIGWTLSYTIAAEIGDIRRFSSPKKLCGYTGLGPRVQQSGARDRRGALAKNGPRHLRWALIEAAVMAARHPVYRNHYDHTKARVGKQRGTAVARIEVARRLAENRGGTQTR